MAYSEKLADRIRESLSQFPKIKVEEKKMFRGIVFMVNGKMCVNVSHDDMMCRIDPELYETALEKKGCRPMVMKGRVYKGFVYVSEEGMKTKKQFDYWIGLAIEFNKKAKASKKSKSPKTK